MSDNKDRNSPESSGTPEPKTSKPRHRNHKRAQRTLEDKVMEQMTNENSGADCYVCAEPIEIAAVYECSHVVCHKCCMRLRALMDDKGCSFCRTDRDHVIMIANDEGQPIEGLVYKDLLDSKQLLPESDDKGLGLYYDSTKTRERVMRLLELVCPVKGCSSHSHGFRTVKDLNKHVFSIHHKKLCEICVKHKKAFSIEYELFTDRELNQHQTKGDEKSGFTGHPKCPYCSGLMLYSEDEMNAHCKQKHEFCFICSRQRGPTQWFKDMAALEKHFQAAHFACVVQSCLDQHFVVFGTEVEYRAHMIKEHPSMVSKEFARIEPVYTPTGSSNGRRGGFGQLSTIDSSSADVVNSLFNFSVSDSSGDNTVTQTAGPVNFEEEFPTLGSATPSRSSSATRASNSSARGHNSANRKTTQNTGDSNDSLAIRQRRLDERARNYLKYDSAKFATFQETNDNFIKGKLDASTLLHLHHKLFDGISPSEFDLLITGIEGVVPNPKKKALNVAYAKFMDSTSNSSTSVPSTPSLKSKGKSAWGNRSVGLSQSSQSLEAFPALPTSAKTNTRISRLTPARGAASLAKPSTAKPAKPSQSLSMGNSDFPSLPTTNVKKPPQLPTEPVVAVNQWTGEGSSHSASGSDTEFVADSLAGSRSKKGKKKVIYHVGL